MPWKVTLARLVPLQTCRRRASSPAATPQGRECPGRRGGLGFPARAGCGLSRAARGGEALWPRFSVCGQLGWPLPSGLDVFLGNFGALGLTAGSGLASFGEGPQWALGGQRPGCAAQRGCRERRRPKAPLLQGSELLIAGFPTFGAPGRHGVPGFRGTSRWVRPSPTRIC